MQLDPNPSDSPRSTGRRRRSALTDLFLLLLVVGVLLLRNDWWNWNSPHPLLLGVIPVGLWWQVMVSLAATGMMWLMVRLAWPAHLEDVQPESSPTKRS